MFVASQELLPRPAGALCCEADLARGPTLLFG
jgi:hypothetical protein